MTVSSALVLRVDLNTIDLMTPDARLRAPCLDQVRPRRIHAIGNRRIRLVERQGRHQAGGGMGSVALPGVETAAPLTQGAFRELDQSSPGTASGSPRSSLSYEL